MQHDLWGDKMKVSEAMVLKDVTHFLTLKGVYFWRNNSGAYKSESGAFVRFGKKGTSDIVGVYPGGRFFAVECKKPGGKLSDEQIEFLKSVRLHGGVVCVAESVDDVDKCLRNPEYIALDRYRRLIV